MNSHINRDQRNDLFAKVTESISVNSSCESINYVVNICNINPKFMNSFNKVVSNKFPSVMQDYAINNKKLGDIQLNEVVNKNNSKISIANLTCTRGKVGPKTKRTISYYYFALTLAKLNYAIMEKNKNTDNSLQLHIPKISNDNFGANSSFILELIGDIVDSKIITYYYG